MAYAAILFDMDGTLLDTGRLWDRATRQSLLEHTTELSEEELGWLAFRMLVDVLKEKGHDEHTIYSIRDKRDNLLLPIIRAEAQWREGAEALVQSITVPTAIVTSTHEYVFTALEETLSLRDIFDAIILADDVRPHIKPHPKGLLLACERLNVHPSHCVYIGDQSCDLEAAAAAGMDAILMRGPHTPADLQHPEMAEDMAGLSKILLRLQS